MTDRFEVRREQCGDNESYYAVWDNGGTQRPHIVSLWPTKEAAEGSAAAWREVFESPRTPTVSE